MTVLNLVLCPPVMVFASCIDCEYGTPAGLETNLMVVGLLNAALYATIAAGVSGKKSKFER